MWPGNQRSSATEDSEKEKVKKFTTLQIKEGVMFYLEQVTDINRYGTEMKIYKVTALVKRFVDSVKKSMKKEVRKIGEVTTDEINEAKKMWIRRVQHDIQVNTLLSRQLGVDKDVDRILRCYGRLENSELSDDAKKPILLPGNHRLTLLMTKACHRRTLHGGARQTLAELRSMYWVCKGRQYVKKIIRSCGVCKRYIAQPFGTTVPSKLPAFRVKISRPFANTGVNFAGPLYLKEGICSTLYM